MILKALLANLLPPLSLGTKRNGHRDITAAQKLQDYLLPDVQLL